MRAVRLTVRLQPLPGLAGDGVSVTIVGVEVSPVPVVDVLLRVWVVRVVVVSVLLLLLLLVLLVVLEMVAGVRVLSLSVISSRDVTICSHGLTIRLLNVP